MAQKFVAVVTGANRGIGEAICQAIVHGQSPGILYAASRGGVDLEVQAGPGVELRYPKLDITDRASITNLVRQIERESGSVTVLINNAGFNKAGSQSLADNKQIMDVNFRGTLEVCQSFVPLLKPGGRIVNLSSVGSTLTNEYSQANKDRLRDTSMRLADLEIMADEWETSLRNRCSKQDGWPVSGYSMSKACINAMTAILARDNPELTVNCCCPGWVGTDMGRQVGSNPPKTVAEGAAIPVRLGFGDIGDVSGRYWANDSISSREAGQVQVW